MNKSLTATAAGLALLCASGCNQSHIEAQNTAAALPVLEVKTARPRRGEISRSIVLPGTIAAHQQATLYAKIGGYLKTIAVDKGDEVKQGEVLAEIEVPELLADEARFKAELNVAELDFKRVQEAVKKAPDLVVAQSVDQARGRMEIARANLERNETLLGYARIIAPFSGVVTRRMVDPGAFIPAATSGSAAQTAALVTLADLSRVRAQVAVPENEVKHVRKGTPVAFGVEGLPGKPFQGAVTRISFALDEATKTMLAETELDNPQRELLPGMYSTARLFVEKRSDALLVPADAVLVEKTKSSVFTINGGKAKKVPVKTGFADGTSVEITEGITPDIAVVLLGKQSLSDGQPVQVKP